MCIAASSCQLRLLLSHRSGGERRAVSCTGLDNIVTLSWQWKGIGPNENLAIVIAKQPSHFRHMMFSVDDTADGATLPHMQSWSSRQLPSARREASGSWCRIYTMAASAQTKKRLRMCVRVASRPRSHDACSPWLTPVLGRA